MGRTGEHPLSSLYRTLPPYFSHSDSRGSITGLLNQGEWREVNLIASSAGVTRGRHYHAYTTECFIVLSGRIRVQFRRPAKNGNHTVEEREFGAGEVFLVPPLVEHTFDVLTEATWINLLSSAMDPENPDFHRY